MSEIVGNKNLLSNLKRIAISEKVSHSYIFNGIKGSGKMMIADYFAKMLECENTDKPCGYCTSCVQWENQSHPDIIYVKHEKPNLISVDDVRKQILETIHIKPYANPYKIYIVDEAEKMNSQAQNALLKTLEEPPEYAVILLITTNAENFLDTILSRSVKLEVQPLSKDQVTDYLVLRGYDKMRINSIVHISGGSIGKALQMVESESFNDMFDIILNVLRNLMTMSTEEMLSFVRRMSQYKIEVNDALDYIKLWFRDVMVYKTRADINLLTFQEEARAIHTLSGKISFKGINEILDAVDKAQERLNANVNFELTMELLLVSIKEQIQ